MVEENNIAKQCIVRKSILWLICLIVLVSGIAIGTGVTIILVKQRILRISKPHKDANDITTIMTKKYGLNQVQSQQVNQILSKVFQQRKLDDEEQDKKRDIYAQSIISDMNSVLTPAQFEKWNKDFQEMRAKFKKHSKK